MLALLTAICLLAGTFFMFVAAVGLLRMPDVYMRMSSTTKASTLGASFLMLAVALHFDDPGVTGRALAIIAFLFLTTPVAAHMIGRAAYLDGVPLWPNTVRDELAGRYDKRVAELANQPIVFADQMTPAAESPAAAEPNPTGGEPPATDPEAR